MSRSNLILLTISSMILLFGCNQGGFLDSDFTEADALLNINPEAVEVDAASFHVDSTISETVKLTSSRSWSLTIPEQSTWMTISKINGMNLGKVMKEWPLALTFEDNYGEERQTSVCVTVEGNRVELPVLQKKFQPVLELVSQSSCTLPEEGGIVEIAVRSNCRWTASISGTANASISKVEGTKSDNLLCTVTSNLDTSSEKQSIVVISADGVADVIVNITQAICIPILEVDFEKSETDVLPVEGDSQIVFNTNESWTAILEDGAAAGVSLSSNEGKPSDKLYVHFPNATIEDAIATVVITTASGLSERITLTQRGCIFIPFRIYPDNNGATKSYQPWKLSDGGSKVPTRKTADMGAGTWNVVDSNNNSYVICSGTTESVFYGEACGLTLGSVVENPAFYIQFPALEGKTLKGVKVMLGNSDVPLKDGSNCEPLAKGTNGWITDTQNNVVSGGEPREVRTYQKDNDWNTTQTIPSFHSDYHNHLESMFHFELSETTPGTAYRFAGNDRMVIRWFILYYE